MSAFAAVQKREENAQNGSMTSSYIPPNTDPGRSSFPPNHSLLTNRCDNIIYTYDSIYVGTKFDPYLNDCFMITGSFEIIVHRGTFLINNLHELNEGDTAPIIVPENQSVPVFYTSSSPEKTSNKPKQVPIMPQYPCVLQIRNLHTGLMSLGDYCPDLKKMYRQTDHYTFRLLLYESKPQLPGVFINKTNFQVLNSLTLAMCMPRQFLVMVIGAKSCGKSTFAKILKNNIANAGQKVAYMDLDPTNSEYSIPGTLSLTIHTKPTFGMHFPKTNALDSEDMYIYYGFDSPNAMPDHYMSCCKQLLTKAFELCKQHIPVVINTATGVRGAGKDFIVEFSKQMNCSYLVYLSQNGPDYIGNARKSDDNYAPDNTDADVLEGVKCNKSAALRGVKVKNIVSSSVTKVHNMLMYFHCEGLLKFNFDKHILYLAPLKLLFARGSKSSPESVCGVFMLGCDSDKLTTEDVIRFCEASIVGLCLIPARKLPKQKKKVAGKKVAESGPEWFKQEDYLTTTPKFVCLCMVHSVNIPEGFFNVYLPQPDDISKSVAPYLEDGYRLAMVRGDSEIPAPELLMPELLQNGSIPYASKAKMRVGGVWKPRKNLGRKNV